MEKIVVSGMRFDYLPDMARKVKRTDEGYLSGYAAIARTGIMTYRLADGTTRREYVPPETLFNGDSMETLKLKPITDAHPPEKILDASTVKRRHIGTVGESVKQDDNYLVAPIVIMDGEAIKGIEGGRQQLSPGYHCELELKPGEYNGERYDAIQVKRVYNHVAIVDNARGGPDLKLHLDGIDNGINLDGFEQTETPNPQKRSGRMLKKITLDGIEYEASPEVALRLDRLEKELAGSKAAIDGVKAEAETLKAECDTLKMQLDEANARDIQAEARAIAAARTKLEREAVKYLSKEQAEKLDSMTDAEIRNAVILRAFPKAEAQIKDASDAYISARYDSAVEMLDSVDADAIARQREAVNAKKTRIDSAEADQEASRKKMIEETVSAYVKK